MSNASTLPGRLGNPDMVLRDDPRIDPRILATLAAFEMDGAGDAPPVNSAMPREALLEFCGAVEPAFEGLFEALSAGLERPAGVTSEVITIPGDGGHEISLHIHKPAETGVMPGVLHIHGGGMAILSTAGPIYARWRDLIAAEGHVVIGVEFRNTAGVLGSHAFPAGLDDCSAALAWMHENRSALGLSKIVISGESGGGNLSLATAIKAVQDGRGDQVDGVYALCPYISNAYAEMPDIYPSMRENDGYFVRCDMLDVMAALYDGPDSVNPLAWPGHADAAVLKGLPPVMISVNELDPLRDEGPAFYEALAAAGVSVDKRISAATTHAADVVFQAAAPDITAATVTSLKEFAAGL